MAHFAEKCLQIDEGIYPTDQTTGLIKLNSNFSSIATKTNSSTKFIQTFFTSGNIDDDTNFNIEKKIPSEEGIYKSINAIENIKGSIKLPSEFLTFL